MTFNDFYLIIKESKLYKNENVNRDVLNNYSDIKSMISGGKISKRYIRKLSEKFALQYLWEKESVYFISYQVLSFFRDLDTTYFSDDIEVWKLVINRVSFKDIECYQIYDFSEVKNRYESLICLSKDFKFNLEQGEVNIDLACQIFRKIEVIIKAHGVNFILHLLNDVSKYKKDYGMYYFPICTSYNNSEIVPYGMLINLGLKYLELTPIKSRFIKDYEKIFNLSTHLATILDFHFTGQAFSLMFSDGENFIDETIKLVYCDAVFRIN